MPGSGEVALALPARQAGVTTRAAGQAYGIDCTARRGLISAEKMGHFATRGFADQGKPEGKSPRAGILAGTRGMVSGADHARGHLHCGFGRAVYF